MTTSAQQYDGILYVPVARRLDSIPQSVSDHYPIALEWRLRRQTKRHTSKLNQSSQDNQTQEQLINRPLPEWLFEDERFATHLATTIDNWNKHRMPEKQRINRIHRIRLQRRAHVFEKYQIEAVTPHHKFEITFAVLTHLENHNEPTKIPIDMQKMNHWMKRYLTLAEKIEFGIDLEIPGKVWVGQQVYT